MQAESAYNLHNFQTNFQVNAAIIQKLGAFLPKSGETRYTALLQYYRTSLQHLLTLQQDVHIAQELRDAVWELLFEQGRTGLIPPECERDVIRFLSSTARESSKFEQYNRLFDETPAPAPTFILHLFVAALAERGASTAVVRVLEDFGEQPEKAKNAILALYYLHYWEAVTLASEAFLKKEGLPPAWHRELEDIMLFIAEQTGDTTRQQLLLRQRFLLSGSFELYEKLKLLSGPQWLGIRQELATTLEARGERYKLASMLALDKDMDALAQLLDQEGDIRQFQRFEALFLPDERIFVRDR